jgi:hypothetical protein
MRHFLRTAFLGFSALYLTGCAQAQYGRYPRGGPDPYYRNDPYNRDDRYNRNDPYYSGRSDRAYGGIVDRVLSDLNRVQGFNRGGRNRKEIDRAREDLLRFRDRQAGGHFDRGRLDSAIENVQRLVNSNWLLPRDRDMLSRDLYALRDFRSNRGYQGWYRD